MIGHAPVLFALRSTHELGERIAARLGLPLILHEEWDFPDGEHKAWPKVSVRGSDIFVVQSLHGDAAASPNDKLCRLLFFLGALRDAGAARRTERLHDDGSIAELLEPQPAAVAAGRG
jgi:ribose-phosphate pyrophosphokinase